MGLFSRKSEEEIKAEKELKIKDFLNNVSLQGLNESNFEYRLARCFNSLREQILELKSMIIPDEKIEYLMEASNTIGDKISYGVLACTNKRILFSGKLAPKIITTFTSNQIPIEKINSISITKGASSIGAGIINITDESCSHCFSGVSNAATSFLDVVNKISANLKEKNTNIKKNRDDDIITKLERLAALKEKGILDETEFNIQKKRILEFL